MTEQSEAPSKPDKVQFFMNSQWMYNVKKGISGLCFLVIGVFQLCSHTTSGKLSGVIAILIGVSLYLWVGVSASRFKFDKKEMSMAKAPQHHEMRILFFALGIGGISLIFLLLSRIYG
ncbi:MAG: hypothetical protein WC352_01215 [Candidatus Omnitrophota bacterium]|jgi:NADH:ubiquinone oxidoreductase subunit 4 (subunit M)